MGGHLENMVYREGLEELGLFSLRKQKLRVIFLLSSATLWQGIGRCSQTFPGGADQEDKTQ